MDNPMSKPNASQTSRAEAPRRITPILSLGEELTLLSIGSQSTRRVKGVVRLCYRAYGEPRSYAQAVAQLKQAGLVARTGLMHHLSATEQAKVDARTQHALAVIRSVSVPEDEDTDLVVGMAAGAMLKLKIADHLRARHHIAALGRARPLTRFVEIVCEHFGASSTSALAEMLLPSEKDAFQGGDFDPGVTSGVSWLGASLDS